MLTAAHRETLARDGLVRLPGAFAETAAMEAAVWSFLVRQGIVRDDRLGAQVTLPFFLGHEQRCGEDCRGSDDDVQSADGGTVHGASSRVCFVRW